MKIWLFLIPIVLVVLILMFGRPLPVRPEEADQPEDAPRDETGTAT